MIIKVDCREREIYAKIVDITLNSEKDKSVSKKPVVLKPVTKFHIMDLGDGMTIQVPIPESIDKCGKRNGKSKSLDHSEINEEINEENDQITDGGGGGGGGGGGSGARHKIISARMPIGDMSIERGDDYIYVLFERKTLYDLAASIKDGRYKEQSFRLEKTILHNHNIIYIIEGDLSKYDERRGGISKTAIQSAMVSLLYHKGFSVVRTMNTDETAAFIANFADKIQQSNSTNETGTESGRGFGYYRCRTVTEPEPEPEPVSGKIQGESDYSYSEVAVKKEKRDFITPKNIGEIMLSNIPGVSPKIAAAIMKKYNNSMFEFLVDLKRKTDKFEDSYINSKMNKSPVPSKILAECFADIEIQGYKDSKCIEGNMDAADLGGDETAKEGSSSSSSSRDKHQIRKIGKATIDKIYKYLCSV
jgi:ERCC4-type nuclease